MFKNLLFSFIFCSLIVPAVSTETQQRDSSSDDDKENPLAQRLKELQKAKLSDFDPKKLDEHTQNATRIVLEEEGLTRKKETNLRVDD